MWYTHAYTYTHIHPASCDTMHATQHDMHDMHVGYYDMWNKADIERQMLHGI